MFALPPFLSPFLPSSLAPRTGQSREGKGAGKGEGKELVGATEVAQTGKCSNKLYWT